jgi:hydroxymethylbilane synthase
MDRKPLQKSRLRSDRHDAARMPLKLGTRGSQLALFQARAVAALMLERTGVSCEIVVIKTSGDRLADATLSEIGGKRLFVKEIEDALLSGEVDIAVHSSKDMPVFLPPGLEISAALAREDPRDALVLPVGEDSPTDRTWTIEEIATTLGPAPRIGTSSVRRIAQLSRLFPGATFGPIRGNLDTRLRKLDAGDHDALVLAAAGLRRLERGDRISSTVPIDACVPAPGQGIIAIETRVGDVGIRERVARIDHPAASLALRAERTVIIRLGGGCQMPIGAHAAVTAVDITLTAVVISLDGTRVARAEVRGPAHDPEAVGVAAAGQLLARGADEILADVQRIHTGGPAEAGPHGNVEGLQP